MLSLDLALLVQLVDQILIFVDMVFSHFEQIEVDFLVSRLFPAHESDSLSPLMCVNQSQLESVQNLPTVAASSSPNLQSVVHHITVTQIALSEHMHFSLAICVFAETLHLVLQLQLFGNLIVQNSSCLFKSLLQNAKPNGVEYFLHQAFRSDSFDFLDEQLLLVKILFVSRCFTPCFPSSKLYAGSFCSLLLASMLKPKEDSLFEPSFSNDV